LRSFYFILYTLSLHRDDIHGLGGDFDDLMRRKSWEILDAAEHSALEGYVIGEDEYTMMREFLLTMELAPDPVKDMRMDSGVKAGMLEMFDQQQAEHQAHKGRVVNIRRKRIWFTGAAAAASVLLMTAIWWLVQPTDPGKPLITTTEVAQTTPKASPEPATTPDLTEPALPSPTRDAMEALAGKPESAVASDLSVTSPAFADAAQKKEMAHDMTVNLVTAGELRTDELTIAGAANTETDTRLTSTFSLSQTETVTKEVHVATKQVVGVRPAATHQKGATPARKSRSVSQDPQLVGFLYACP
jgi:hypothetical protein